MIKKNGRVITFGETMCRFSSPEHLRIEQVSPGPWHMSFGGAEGSVAASVARFGGSSEFITALPNHSIAEACIRQLNSFGVQTDHIHLDPNGRMGIYFVERGANQRASQVIYDRSSSCFSDISLDTFNWNEIFKEASWFHTTGITPALSERAALAACHAVKAAKEAGLTVSVDLNFRGKLWNWRSESTAEDLAQEIMPQLLAYTDVVIGNEEDAHKTLGIQSEETDVTAGKLHSNDFSVIAEKIMQRFPNVNIVTTTLRESISATHNNWGAILTARGTNSILSPKKNQAYEPYEICSIVDRVGGGDAFAGALIFALNSGEFTDEQAALDFATAASCLAHSISGDYNLAKRIEIESLIAGDASGRVQR